MYIYIYISRIGFHLLAQSLLGIRGFPCKQLPLWGLAPPPSQVYKPVQSSSRAKRCEQPRNGLVVEGAVEWYTCGNLEALHKKGHHIAYCILLVTPLVSSLKGFMFDTPFCFARESRGIGDLLGRWMWQGLWRSLWSFRNKYVDDRLWVKDSDYHHHVDSCCMILPALPFLDSHVLKHLQQGCLNRGPTLSPFFRATFQVDVFIPPGEAKCMSVTSLQAAFLWWDEATTLLYYSQNKRRLYQCSRIKRWDVIVHDQSCFFACHHQRSCRNGSIWRCLANLAFRSDNCQEEGHRSTKDHL